MENKQNCKHCRKFRECVAVSVDTEVIALCNRCRKAVKSPINNMFRDLIRGLKYV